MCNLHCYILKNFTMLKRFTIQVPQHMGRTSKNVRGVFFMTGTVSEHYYGGGVGRGKGGAREHHRPMKMSPPHKRGRG